MPYDGTRGSGMRLQNVCFYSDDSIAIGKKSEYVKIPIRKNSLSVSESCVFQKYSVSIHFGQKQNRCVLSAQGKVSIFLIDPRCVFCFLFGCQHDAKVTQSVFFFQRSRHIYPHRSLPSQKKKQKNSIPIHKQPVC